MRASRPDLYARILELHADGLTAGAIVTVLRRYHGADVTYDQVCYFLRKSRAPRHRVSKGRVMA